MVTPAIPPPDIFVPEPGPSVSAALTDANVRVTSAFSGAQIVLYGAVFDPDTRPSDVVVIVRGPDQPIRIARKVRVAGLWVNSRPVVFEGAPGFYMAASSRPLTEIASFSTLRRLGAGIDHLPMNAPEEERIETRYGVRDVVVSRLGGDYLEWRRAVIRLKEKASLYATDHEGVRFVDRGLFRAEIDLPTSAPIGEYQTEIILFQDGEPVSRRARTITVEKAGLERWLFLFANEQPWLYGIVSVLIALTSGWLASVVFRRR
ncbi:MAG: TIGR02186 family protein [Phenylobacterium sp.]|uniref:TIGR02186 family protein n=1 Tax=Phenylobacterium sp. TaxID=1871053 RepID=UPI002720F09D|nr:TIGR02186 family protein [Phenylobacterium sp.]MDO8410095.1 TIGR02186 family protein [Phenylobacterium sp.]